MSTDLDASSTVAVTFFENHAATTKEERTLPLHKLCDLIADTTAPQKAALPWLKLARFGSTPTDRGSLRHTANLTEVTGIEGDFDGETMPFDEACQILLRAGVAAIVYTSPSHTEDAPRWRVLCPLSAPLPPIRRDQFLGRLNGLLGGVFAAESWVLSQSYYFGSVANNPSHRAQLILGSPIDLLDTLDAIAIGKPEKPKPSGNGQHSPAMHPGDITDARIAGLVASLLDRVRAAPDGAKHHTLRDVGLTLGGYRHLISWTETEAVEQLVGALPATVEDWDAARSTAAWAVAQGQQRPLEMEDRAPFRGGRGNGADGPAAPSPQPGGESEPPPPATDDPRPGPDPQPDDSRPEPPPQLQPGRILPGADLISEGAVADAFTHHHRDQLRYDHHIGKWFLWDRNRWRPEDTKLAYQWAHRKARALAASVNTSVLIGASKAAFAAGVERLAQSDPAFAVTSEIWDTDPWLLGAPNGTVDLRTGMLRPASPHDYITKATAVRPGEQKDCPGWQAFIKQITGGDAAYARFLQQWCGYSLTGVTREHALLFIFGPGGNGKSVFINTVAAVLGDYCRSAPMDTFTASTGDRHPTDLAMLRGARMVTATETEEGRAWAEARIKQMTGGDRIAARFMRQDFFEYIPQFKLTLIGNHKPVLRSVDDATRRRFNIGPILFVPETRDMQLEEKLRAEGHGILAWMIDGCLDWQHNGLVRPQVVVEATAEYFETQDLLAQWLAERCEEKVTATASSSAMYHDWTTWAKVQGEAPGTQKAFSEAMERRFRKKKTKTGAIFLGLRLLPSETGVWHG